MLVLWFYCLSFNSSPFPCYGEEVAMALKSRNSTVDAMGNLTLWRWSKTVSATSLVGTPLCPGHRLLQWHLIQTLRHFCSVSKTQVTILSSSRLSNRILLCIIIQNMGLYLVDMKMLMIWVFTALFVPIIAWISSLTNRRTAKRGRRVVNTSLEELQIDILVMKSKFFKLSDRYYSVILVFERFIKYWGDKRLKNLLFMLNI